MELSRRKITPKIFDDLGGSHVPEKQCAGSGALKAGLVAQVVGSGALLPFAPACARIDVTSLMTCRMGPVHVSGTEIRLSRRLNRPGRYAPADGYSRAAVAAGITDVVARAKGPTATPSAYSARWCASCRSGRRSAGMSGPVRPPDTKAGRSAPPDRPAPPDTPSKPQAPQVPALRRWFDRVGRCQVEFRNLVR